MTRSTLQFASAVTAVLIFACAPPPPEPAVVPADASPAATAVIPDPHSYARPDQARVEHLTLSIALDFPRKQLGGTAGLRIARSGNADRLILDTRDLTIRGVTLQPGGHTAQFRVGESHPIFGAPLEIALRPDTTEVVVDYVTSPDAAALQWLDPEQTAGKKHPFLLSQSQAILARTWVPIQDTPQVRFTYEAAVRAPKDLLVLMSAENPTTTTPDGVYHFRMPQPIPSYLLVIAAGDLVFRSLGPNSGVYAERPVIDAAAAEFVDTPRMIEAAEALYGPYRWGRYDMLVLPPSFPFGGMENPRLTFLTPTMIAGDRSLVALIAHELAHSWSGNLVTNANWNHFWLNEGFTTYFERRISERMEGRDHAEMLWTLGLTELRDDLGSLPPEDQRLVLDLEGRDPDEGLTQVAYEKGALLLRLLEETVGRERWDAFLRSYFETFAFEPMTTDMFLAHLRASFPGIDQRVNINEWIYGPGLPANASLPQSEAFARVEAQANAFAGGAAASSLDTTGWKSQQWVHFLQSLPSTLGPARMRELDKQFDLSRRKNAEILNAWLDKAIENRYRDPYPALEEFLTSMGRRKFLKPLYTRLAEADAEDREFAMRVYRKARPLYHAVSRQTIDQILGWEEGGGR